MKRKEAKIVMMIVYGGHLIVTSNDDKGIKDLKTYIGTDVEMKYLRTLKYFLELKAVRSKKGIVISQQKYTLGFLERIGKLGANPVDALI